MVVGTPLSAHDCQATYLSLTMQLCFSPRQAALPSPLPPHELPGDSRQRLADPTAESRHDAHVRDVRRPDSLATPGDRPARQTRSQCARALCTGQFCAPRWGGEHLRPQRRSSAPCVHALLHRATLPETAGSSHPDGPWHAPPSFQVAIGPASGIISPDITGNSPRRGYARVCGDARRGPVRRHSD